MVCLPLGSIVEVFFNIDIDTYTPQTKLDELQNLTLSEVETTSENYLSIQVPPGGFYLALDCHLKRLFVLFSNPYSLLYRPEVGKRVQTQFRENIADYASTNPPSVPNSRQHKEYEQWLLENLDLGFRPESRCGAVFATEQSVGPGPGRGRTTFRLPVPSFHELARQVRIKDQDGHPCCPVQLFSELARQVRTKDQDGRHCVVSHRPLSSLSSSVVLYRPPPSSAVFRCFPLFSAVPHRPLSSPAVICSYLPFPRRSCLRSWGSSSLLMTAVLGIQGRGRTAFCRPISSGGSWQSPRRALRGPRTAENTGWKRA